MYGTVPEPEGITDPPIDDLLEKVDSKYALAVYAADRARQINDYRQELMSADGNVVHVGPLVASDPEEKALSIALREIVEDKLILDQPTD
ncbi:DNA-directed RNA polymerase subunit omega [Flaviflexus salsibiostraticola]|uniref:DNA-directed RNA polymerase subunit omega n=1 Tax=Flaviflexus salsibiostraticola TaxID=1282737 RepID=A0A3S8Z6Y0_9ACTO|nr:DNA-directed RNA polymerase subunit omega [Flaviflexus salsibiostraticola]AZN29272.1 DNA-directed RNA polymerase subunit omega [Flaviflexus salsibiostraticola]